MIHMHGREVGGGGLGGWNEREQVGQERRQGSASGPIMKCRKAIAKSVSVLFA